MKIKTVCPGASVELNNVTIPGATHPSSLTINVGEFGFEIEGDAKELVLHSSGIVSDFKNVVTFIREVLAEQKVIDDAEDAKRVATSYYDQSTLDARVESAYLSGKKHGYNDGYNSGRADGFRAGVEDEFSPDESSKAYQDVYDSAFRNGKAEGQVEGRREGFRDGYDQGMKEYCDQEEEKMSKSYRTGYYDGKNRLPSKY